MIFDFEPGDKVVNPNNKEWGIDEKLKELSNFGSEAQIFKGP